MFSCVILSRLYLTECFNRYLPILLQFIENDVMMSGIFFLGCNFVSGRLCTLKSKKSKNFFQRKQVFRAL